MKKSLITSLMIAGIIFSGCGTKYIQTSPMMKYDITGQDISKLTASKICNTDETENDNENLSVIRAAQAKKLKTIYAVDNEETWTVSLFSPPELSSSCITVYGK
jgi:hypothetical protein